jgi:hypothetical protein
MNLHMLPFFYLVGILLSSMDKVTMNFFIFVCIFFTSEISSVIHLAYSLPIDGL